MKTTKANATHNFIVRFWSHKHYGEKLTNKQNMYRGTITETKSKEVLHFHSPADLLKKMEKMYKKAEK